MYDRVRRWTRSRPVVWVRGGRGSRGARSVASGVSGRAVGAAWHACGRMYKVSPGPCVIIEAYEFVLVEVAFERLRKNLPCPLCASSSSFHIIIAGSCHGRRERHQCEGGEG